MSRFLESICMIDGRPRHLSWHQQRVDDTLRHFYPQAMKEVPSFILEDMLASCPVPSNDKLKCRILYDLHTLSVEFVAHTPRQIKTFALAEIPAGYSYGYKYADRSVIDGLWAARHDADDILMTRGGWVTDTSYANIAFRKGERWYTPSLPLLAGTTLKRLIRDGILIPRPIHQDDLHRFDNFRIFNAMNDWGETEENPMPF